MLALAPLPAFLSPVGVAGTCAILCSVYLQHWLVGSQLLQRLGQVTVGLKQPNIQTGLHTLPSNQLAGETPCLAPSRLLWHSTKQCLWPAQEEQD